MSITRISLAVWVLSLVIIQVIGHTEVLFAPDDQPTEKLMSLIKKSHKKIYAAVYMITDKKIAQELINAKRRGVDVKVVVDASTIDSLYGKGSMLKENNIDLYVFRSKSKRQGKKEFAGALMHNKFALIDDQLWTGSFNWTKRANNENQENVIVTTDKEIYAKFEQHFHILKDRCEHYGKAINTQGKDREKPFWQDFFDQCLDHCVSAYKFVKNHVTFIFISDAT